MKELILTNLNNPAQLEKLYRQDKSAFKGSFDLLYPQIQNQPLAGFWQARLNFSKDEISWGKRNELLFIIIGALLAGFIAKLPAIFNLDEEQFYSRNIGFIIFPILIAYFAWRNALPARKIIPVAAIAITGLFFINVFPAKDNSDSLILSCIHLVLLLWSLTGFAFVGDWKNQRQKRLDFLSYNGDLAVMTALILIAGAILSAATIGLFSLIGWRIEEFYFNYVVTIGLPAAPILATWLTQNNPQLVGKVSPVIARIFCPLVLVMLVIYLSAILVSGKDPYNDREFLMIFNGLLIGVMAIIFFSVAEGAKSGRSRIENWLLFLLSIVTILVNGIALSAIVFRITAGGLTPNRVAVLGANILILLNLLSVTVQLFRVINRKAELKEVGLAIAAYLPVYFTWTILVTFILPLIFSFW